MSSTSVNAAEAFLSLVTSVDEVGSDILWEVTRLLPQDDFGPQYHVRAPDGHERLVHESQLEAAPAHSPAE